MFKFGSLESRLDEHISGGHGHKTEIECKCKNLHTWTAKGYTEYGFTEFVNVEEAFCPECGEIDRELDINLDLLEE